MLLKREKDSLLINLTGDNKTLAEARVQLDSFLGKLAVSAVAAKDPTVVGSPFLSNWNEPSGAENEGFIIPSQACITLIVALYFKYLILYLGELRCERRTHFQAR